MKQHLHARQWILALAGVVCLGAACAGPVQADSRFWPTYHWGDKDGRGEIRGVIHALQYLLRAHGYPLATDGIYGRATEKSVRQFQSAQHLVASGEMNKPTWEALIIPVKQGSTGPAVTAAQLRLEEAGFAVPPTGRFDAPTKTAVLKYQAQNGHTADGVIGPSTWSALLEGQGEGDGD